MKVLKIIKRSVDVEPVEAQPAPLVISKPKKLSIKAQKAIEGIIAGKPAGKAMIDAGYSPNTAINPTNNLLGRSKIKDELDPFVKNLLAHRDEILIYMRSSVQDAEYGALSTGLNAVIKNIQLLTGRATGKIGFELPDDQAEAIKAVIMQNASK